MRDLSYFTIFAKAKYFIQYAIILIEVMNLKENKLVGLSMDFAIKIIKP